MKYFRVHMKDCAYITKQPRGIFTSVGKLVDSKILNQIASYILFLPRIIL